MSHCIVVYWAAGCHLCEPAKTIVRAVAAEHDVAVREVDISGDAELEARYRTQIPVVEIDGRKAFKYVVEASALAARLRAPAP